jgi:cell division control protein 12
VLTSRFLKIGESGLGKTTFINTLLSSLIKEPKDLVNRHSSGRTLDIHLVRAGKAGRTADLLDIEENGFHTRLSIADTPGFGDYINNADCWQPIVRYIDEQYQKYLDNETKADRKNVDDMRIHACLYFIAPSGHTLKPLDILAMKELGKRVNLVPVIAKADTLTPAAMASFKQIIRDCITAHDIQVYHPSSSEEEEENDTFSLINAMPFSVIGSMEEVNVNGTSVRGREYLWGVAEGKQAL